MRYIITLLLALLLGYGMYLVSLIGPANYVKVYAGNYLWETKLLSFIIAIVFFVLALQLILYLIKLIWRTPGSLGRWRNKMNKRAAAQALGDGYLFLIKGDWRQAEKRLLTKSESSSVPYVNYLAAAQAAQAQGKYTKRAEYLNLALKAAPKERFAIGLTKARLHLEANELSDAEATLMDLVDQGRKNRQYISLLLQTYERSGNWQEALKLLPTARKLEAMEVSELEKINDAAYSISLRSATDLDQAWKQLPRAQKKRVVNIGIYAHSLMQSGHMAAAEKVLRTGIKTHLSDELIRLYGNLESDKPAKLRKQVESWCAAQPDNAELHLAAGHLAMQEKNLELAKEHLQKAIQLGQLPRAYALLGEVYEMTNESGRALQLFRAGMGSLSQKNERSLISGESPVIEGELLLAGGKAAE